jgi:macrodomain Ter protein organizer (MatP/YcbG family)
MKRTNIYLSEIQWKKLKAIAKETGLGISEMIRRMIDDGLRKYEVRRKR